MKTSFILASLLILTITLAPVSCGWLSDLFKKPSAPSSGPAAPSTTGVNLITDPDGDYTQRITMNDKKFFNIYEYTGPFSSMTKLSLFGTYEGQFLGARTIYFTTEPSKFSWTVNTWFRKSTMTSTIIFRRANKEFHRATVNRKNNDNSWFNTDYVFEYSLDPNRVALDAGQISVEVLFDDKNFSFSTMLVVPDAILRTAETPFQSDGYFILPLIFSDVNFSGTYTIECNIYDDRDVVIAHSKNTDEITVDNNKFLLRFHLNVIGRPAKWTVKDFTIRSSRGGYAQAGVPHFALNL